MIGMMYLVLTAMLALNVSKEAVEAFKKVDKVLLRHSKLHPKKRSHLQRIRQGCFWKPCKGRQIQTLAYQVKERADEAFNFIQGLKIEIIKKAEKDPETPAVKGNEVIIEEVKELTTLNVPL